MIETEKNIMISLTIVTLIILSSTIVFHQKVDGNEIEIYNEIYLFSGTSGTSVGYLYAGMILQYNWSSDDDREWVEFEIRDQNTLWVKLTNISSSRGSFPIPQDGDYKVHFRNRNLSKQIVISLYIKVINPPQIKNYSLDVKKSFSINPCYQGNTTTLQLSINNPNEDNIIIKNIGIVFDFFPIGMTINNTAIMANLTINQTTIIYFDIGVKNDIDLGMHNYSLHIEYEARFLNHWYSLYWESGNATDFFIIEKDSDWDSYPDSEDAFPNDVNEWKDTDEDGVGDNLDQFPNDPNEYRDVDGDNKGDVGDEFPLDPNEWQDFDGDGYGDNGDVFPSDPDEWIDSDGDNHGDNRDVFPYNQSEWSDTDNDGVGDNIDAFPLDPSASVDIDKDGHPDSWNAGKNEMDSTTELTLDDYPDNPDKWRKENKKIPWTVIIAIPIILIIISLGIGMIIYTNRRNQREVDLD